METGRLKRAINELRLDSLSTGNSVAFPVLSDSMAPLLMKGDDIHVKKVAPDEIGLLDIIVWNPLKNADAIPRSYVAHRVVMRRKNGSYITKGDLNIFWDSDAVPFGSIIGKVVCVDKHRWGGRVRLDSCVGMLFNLSCWWGCVLITPGIAVLRSLRAFLANMLSVFPFRKFSAGMIDYSSCGISSDDWQRAVGFFRGWHKDRHFSSIGDVLIQNNYSEEALGLLRQGMAVTGVDPAKMVSARHTFDLLIAARLLNRLPARQLRLDFLRSVFVSLKPGGILFLNLVNPQKDWGERLYTGPLHAVFALLWNKRCKGTMSDELFLHQRFMRHSYTVSDLRGELRDSGWNTIVLSVDGPVINGIAIKEGSGKES